MERSLALELVRVTEAAALSCAKWYGRGNIIEAVNAASNAMKQRLDYLDLQGTIVNGIDPNLTEITEFTKALTTGQKVGSGKGPALDLSVNPVECDKNLAKGRLNSCSLICAAPPGGILKVPNLYMEKLAVGPALKGKVSLTQPVEEILQIVADVYGKEIEEVTVCVLDRERNIHLIEKIRKFGPRIRMFADGDLAGAIGTYPGSRSDIDILLGSGRALQGVMSAVGLKALGGDFQGRFLPQNEKEKKIMKSYNLDPNKIYARDDLAPSNKVDFVVTGISQCPFLKGVRFDSYGAKTRSLVVRSASGTIRYIDTYHKFS